jgi:hypothetical protein
MSDDLVKRLRYDAKKLADDICGEAADRITLLEEQLLTTTTFLEDALGRIDIENPVHSIWMDVCEVVIGQSKIVTGKKDD